MDDISTLIKWIKESNDIVFFGGAGVSTESGLKDFRSVDGLYNESYDFSPEEILSHHFFMIYTKDFYKFYREKLNVNDCSPNITHTVLKELEDIGKLNCIITQNIDGFHSDAGSTNVLELHGSIKRNYCIKCGKFFDEKFIFSTEGIPKCNCGGIIKPDVVLYEEILDDDTIHKAIYELENADLLIIGGTSLNVYPAAGLLKYFHGKHIVLINKDVTVFDDKCDLIMHKNIGNVFKEIEKEIILE